MPGSIPMTGTRTTLDRDPKAFLSQHPNLHLGGTGDFHDERNHYTVEFTAIRGPHGTIPIRVLYPSSGQQHQTTPSKTALRAAAGP
ncbi:hypothetical protein MMC20_002796 [Loxospora ochrophaea]|nr:hypothetical protein [Loxospora ochrophaea]